MISAALWGVTPTDLLSFCGYDYKTNTMLVDQWFISWVMKEQFPRVRWLRWNEERWPFCKGNLLWLILTRVIAVLPWTMSQVQVLDEDSWVNWHIQFARKRETCNLWLEAKWGLIFLTLNHRKINDDPNSDLNIFIYFADGQFKHQLVCFLLLLWNNE